MEDRYTHEPAIRFSFCRRYEALGMDIPFDGDFSYFVTTRKKDLQRIASGTRGEYQLSDVINEAWLLASTMTPKAGATLDLGNPEHQKLLLSYLYQALVRYTDTRVRYAVRLDHSPYGDEDDMHPIARSLSAIRAATYWMSCCTRRRPMSSKSYWRKTAPWHPLISDCCSTSTTTCQALPITC